MTKSLFCIPNSLLPQRIKRQGNSVPEMKALRRKHKDPIQIPRDHIHCSHWLSPYITSVFYWCLPYTSINTRTHSQHFLLDLSYQQEGAVLLRKRRFVYSGCLDLRSYTCSRRKFITRPSFCLTRTSAATSSLPATIVGRMLHCTVCIYRR